MDSLSVGWASTGAWSRSDAGQTDSGAFLNSTFYQDKLTFLRSELNERISCNLVDEETNSCVQKE